MSKYPECEKMKNTQPESQAIGNFLEWAEEQGLELVKSRETARHGSIIGTGMSVEQLLAKHFDIDLNAVEKERRLMLEAFNT